MNVLDATMQMRECHEKLISIIEPQRDQIFQMNAAKPQTVEDVPKHQWDLLLICLQIVSAELSIRAGSKLLEDGKREFDAHIQ
ncbi:hypothetical protein [Rubinisphaera brasiliensis]|uniref:Uncharacterized protein n=1 Tax=Rubinisphaera brasiliensis (strain ATCC 49424 / DSM 5305 / JCM 21570 / IAM 15109 / NBRC 103401 / IFAM 1448) TaxID=756272 RepID=F0SQ68_RUBBR|nr:hypothetical protein [Rubinisphaera brasiliensis]ADY61245.1 hypothetical protein Plabr_3648 [Rubinisphaera brasiliensis DSM 5305]